MLFNVFSSGTSSLQSREISYSDFVASVERGEVATVILDGENIRFKGGDNVEYVTVRPADTNVTDLLIENQVVVRAEKQEQSLFQSFIMSILPFLLLIGVWIYFMNRMQGGGRGGAMGFGKSRAKLLTEKQGRVTFDDVAGIACQRRPFAGAKAHQRLGLGAGSGCLHTDFVRRIYGRHRCRLCLPDLANDG